jgi:LuxR family transcriptional regulator, quorum-sensing system regulator SdiA
VAPSKYLLSSHGKVRAMVVVVQPCREQRTEMIQRACVAALLEELDRRSPAGFAIGLHIRFTTPTYMFQTYPKRWVDHYSSAGLLVDDPVVRWGFHNVGHIQWTDLEAIDNKRVLDRAKDFGLMNGVAISVLNSASRSIGGFARADRDYDEREMTELEAAFAQLHRATLGMTELSESDRDALTEMSIRLTR